MVSLWIGLLIAGVSIYYGILYDNTLMITIGFTLAVLLVLSVVELIIRLFTLKCRLDIPISMAETEMPVTVYFQLRNKLPIPSGRVDVRMRIRNSMSKKGKARWQTIPQVPVGISRHGFKVVLYGAGNYEVDLIQMRIYSYLGLFSWKKKCKDFQTVLVMPQVYSMRIRLTEGTRNFLGDADVYDEFRPGHDPAETFEIREYRPKDKLQSIHWKLSAKRDELMVRQTSLPQACAVVLFADCKAGGKGRDEADIVAFLELVSSVSFCLLEEKCPHFIAWMSKETQDVRRIRVDDEESFYIFLMQYLRDGAVDNKKNLRDEYRQKYKNEWYVHDICINSKLEIYKDEELLQCPDAKKLKDECEKMEILL